MVKQPKPGQDAEELRGHATTWNAWERYDRVLRVATATADFAITSPDLDEIPDYRREILGNTLWFMTCQPSGKYATRYRSKAVIDEDRPVLRHEHVYTRKSVITDLLALNSEELDEAALRHSIQEMLRERAVGCTVTLDEHRLLSRHDKTLVGWQRYAASGVTVLDMSTGEVLNTGAIT